MIDSPENELILRAQCGDVEAENAIVTRYERAHSRFGGGDDERRQLARIATWTAIKRYRPDGGAKFSSYAITGMKLRVRTTYKQPPKKALAVLALPGTEPTTPEESCRVTERAARMAALVSGCKEMDLADRIIYRMRILEEVTRRDTAKVLRCGITTVFRREERLRNEILPRLFAELA